MEEVKDTPRIISVDDHVVEPPDLWTSRLGSKYGDRAPHVERDRATVRWVEGKFVCDRGQADGVWCDWWVFEDVQIPFSNIFASVGFDTFDNEPTTFDEIHPGAWKQDARLADMTADHIEASLCFPNMFPRFCGQTFSEAKDKELGLACIEAYNDWILDEWSAGAGHGRLLPLTIMPLWDIELAVREVRRCAAKGSLTVAFSENPYQLGLPSIHSGYWDPLFAECADTDLTLTMHIGSSSRMPSTSPDAPIIVSSSMHFVVTVGSVLDYIFSGVMDRYPNLKLFFAESQAGWLPYVLEQADWLWGKREGASLGSPLPKPPSTYFHDRMWTSVFSDGVALANRDAIGIDQICFETDYPHSVTTFPHTKREAEKLCANAGLSERETYKLLRGNAIAAFGLDRVGISA